MTNIFQVSHILMIFFIFCWYLEFLIIFCEILTKRTCFCICMRNNSYWRLAKICSSEIMRKRSSSSFDALVNIRPTFLIICWTWTKKSFFVFNEFTKKFERLWNLEYTPVARYTPVGRRSWWCHQSFLFDYEVAGANFM